MPLIRRIAQKISAVLRVPWRWRLPKSCGQIPPKKFAVHRNDQYVYFFFYKFVNLKCIYNIILKSLQHFLVIFVKFLILVLYLKSFYDTSIIFKVLQTFLLRMICFVKIHSHFWFQMSAEGFFFYFFFCLDN